MGSKLVVEDELIYGLHTVAAALREGQVVELWMAEQRQDRKVEELRAAAVQQGVAVYAVPRSELDERSGGAHHQGVVARQQPPRVSGEGDLEGFLDALETPAFLLVLDGVQDPHNLGACLRSADAAGAHAVIIPKARTAGLSGTVARVASGAAQTVPLFQVANLARALRRLQKSGVWLVGADSDSAATLYETDLTGPLALVLGAEGKGLRRLTRETCDLLASIPMAGTVGSLNVSVAAGVCLFEAVRQRKDTREKIQGDRG